MGIYRLLFVMVALLVSSVALADETTARLVDADLIEVHADEIRRSNPERVAAMNEATLRLFDPGSRGLREERERSSKRARGIDLNFAEHLIQSIDQHPIVSYWGDRKYQQEDVKIGFCFGRAMYAHLSALKLGIAKQSIKKAWLVGPMKAGDVTWQFHVATIVRAEDNEGWFVIDNYHGRATKLREWFELFKPQNRQGNLRIYVTDPEKFSVSLGKYDRIQLGLDLSPKQDWYRHYFKDLMKWFSNDRAAKEFFGEHGLIDARREL